MNDSAMDKGPPPAKKRLFGSDDSHTPPPPLPKKGGNAPPKDFMEEDEGMDDGLMGLDEEPELILEPVKAKPHLF
jgi:hypothetical protein